MIVSFDPIEATDARVLILGTLPSAASLEAGYNYGHPRNAFWYIIQALTQNSQDAIQAALASGDVSKLITIDPARLLDFEIRRRLLIDNKIALWDSLRSAARDGSSLDSAIDAATEIPNDIPGFLRTHPGVRAIFFNGTKSESVFKRLIAPKIAADEKLSEGLSNRQMLYHRLPSTSPANAGIPLAKKLEAWNAIMLI